MKYYAIADIHGKYDLLLEAYTQIHDHVGAEKYLIVTLGDYIDRGPKSKQVIDFLMDRDGGDTLCLQGNHERIMLQSIVLKMEPDWWVRNGGGETLLSYGAIPVEGCFDTSSYAHVPEDHLRWLASLDLYYETEKQVFVHAGIPQWGMNLEKASDRNQEKMQWMLYDKRDSGGWKGKHVVHGHRQFEDGPHTWYDEKKGGRTDLDTWAYHTGRLVVGVFDDTQLHAIDYIEIKETEYGYKIN